MQFFNSLLYFSIILNARERVGCLHSSGSHDRLTEGWQTHCIPCMHNQHCGFFVLSGLSFTPLLKHSLHILHILHRATELQRRWPLYKPRVFLVKVTCAILRARSRASWHKSGWGWLANSKRGGVVWFVASKWRPIYSFVLLLSALSSEELSPAKVRDHYTFNISKLATP